MFYYFILLLIGYYYLLTYLPVSYPYYAHALFWMCLKYYRPYDHTSNYLSNMKNLLSSYETYKYENDNNK